MKAPPNILWIVTTQWRATAFGYAGDPNAHTPNLDALAARSVNYSQVVTPHPFGPFARAAMLTGARSPDNGVCDYFDPLPLDAQTIAHALVGRGYATAFFGKWHLARRDPKAALVGAVHARTVVPPGARGGFETWEGFESGFLLNDPWLHGTRLIAPTQFGGYQSDIVTARAATWVTAATSMTKPVFAIVSLEAPHPPYDAPAAGVVAQRPEEIRLSANVPHGGEAEIRARRELAGYYAHIEATDRAVGRLLAAVGETAVVVFTSVHGDMHGSHGLFRKGWPHEESVRVPLLVSGAPESPSHGVSHETVSLLDLPAMTRAWADGGAWHCDRTYAGISMPSVVALPHQCDRVWRGLRAPDRKIVLNADGSPWLFFDLEADPLERRNFATDLSRAREIAMWRERCEHLFSPSSR